MDGRGGESLPVGQERSEGPSKGSGGVRRSSRRAGRGWEATRRARRGRKGRERSGGTPGDPGEVGRPSQMVRSG